MNGYLKDDLTVALDDVDRVLYRAATIHLRLGHLAPDEALAASLTARGEALERALTRFNEAREAEGQVPELEDPERAQIEALWLKLKSWVAQEGAEASFRESLARLDETVLETIDRARELGPGPVVAAALDALRAEVAR